LKLLTDVGFLWEGSRRSLKEKIAAGGTSGDDDAQASASVSVTSTGGGENVDASASAVGQGSNTAAIQAAMNMFGDYIINNMQYPTQ